MKRTISLVLVLIFALCITGCDEFFEEKNEVDDGTEEERTFRDVVYDRGVAIERTYKDRHGSRSYTDYFVFDKETNRFLMWYGSNKFCDIYEGVFEGELKDKEIIKIKTHAPIDYEDIKLENRFNYSIKDALYKIEGCQNNYHKYE